MAEQNADMIKITGSARRDLNSNEGSVWTQTGGGLTQRVTSKWKSAEGNKKKKKKDDGPVD